MIYKKSWKYILIKDDTYYCIRRGYYRPKAIKDFSSISKGDIGGFIDGYHNLSQNGNCWVGNSAIVSGNSIVYDNAKVFNKAIIYGNAQIYEDAKVFGKAMVNSANAKVSEESARIFGKSKIFGNAQISGHAIIYDNAQVCGNATIYGNAHICGNTIVKEFMANA